MSDPDPNNYQALLHTYNWTGLGNSSTQAFPDIGVEPDDDGIYQLTYYFPTTASDLLTSGGYTTSDSEYVYFAQVTAAQQTNATIILGQSETFDYSYSDFYSDVANITFAASNAASAQILISQNDPSSGYWEGNTTALGATVYDGGSSDPVDEDREGDIYFNDGVTFNGSPLDWTTIPLGSVQFQTIMHELGHALGLKHPDESDGSMPTLGSTNYLDNEYSQKES